MNGTIPLLVVIVCLGAAAGAGAQTQADERAIRQAIDAMTAAFNNRDDAATGAVATSDADFVTVTGNLTKGTKAYTEARQKRFATVLKNASIAPIATHMHINEPGDVEGWLQAAPGRFIGGPAMPCSVTPQEPFFRSFLMASAFSAVRCRSHPRRAGRARQPIGFSLARADVDHRLHPKTAGRVRKA